MLMMRNRSYNYSRYRKSRNRRVNRLIVTGEHRRIIQSRSLRIRNAAAFIFVAEQRTTCWLRGNSAVRKKICRLYLRRYT